MSEGEEENLVLVQTKTVPVCRTVAAYIYVTYLWCTRTFGVNLMSEKLPHHRLFPLLSSLFRSRSPFLFPSSSPWIPATFDSFYRGPSTYLSLTSHEKYIRDFSALFSRFRLSVLLLAFSQPFQWWFSRVPDEKNRDRPTVALRSLPSKLFPFL